MIIEQHYWIILKWNINPWRAGMYIIVSIKRTVSSYWNKKYFQKGSDNGV
jgi:hypothetical protein